MALRVAHINGDSTFLLTFYPTEADASSRYSTAGTFSVLVDPWLEGDSTIFHRKFALAKHTISASVQHLSELPAPNAVVVSQDRTDHCHGPTLKQLDPSLPKTHIFAHPAAAKRIKSWKYFDSSKVVAFPIFNDKKPETIIRFSIPPQYPGLEPGEATLAFIPSRFDITGTHNAIGITYRAPSAFSTLPGPMNPPVVTIPFPESRPSTRDIPSTPRAVLTNLPPTPPESPELSTTRSQSPRPALHAAPPPSRSRFTKIRTKSYGALRQAAKRQRAFGGSAEDLPAMPKLPVLSRAASPQTVGLPATPATSSFGSIIDGAGPSTVDSSPIYSVSSNRYSNGSARDGKRPRTLSVIYSPHGVSYPAVRQYASSHLVRSAGLPLTLLLHAFDRVTNAWYLGGNIIAGMPGGVEIARNLLAQCWISAHDEDKESSGVAVQKCITDKYNLDDVRRILVEAEAGSSKKSKGMTDVRKLGVGECAVLAA